MNDIPNRSKLKKAANQWHDQEKEHMITSMHSVLVHPPMVVTLPYQNAMMMVTMKL